MTRVHHSSPDLECGPKRSSRVQYQVFQMHGSWHQVLVAGAGWVPDVDLYETETELILEVNLGGVDPGKIQIQFEGQVLHLSGQRLETTEAGIVGYYIMEIDRGQFVRSIELPSAVDSAKAQATSQDGLLTVRIPKCDSGYSHGCWSANSMEGLE